MLLSRRSQYRKFYTSMHCFKLRSSNHVLRHSSYESPSSSPVKSDTTTPLPRPPHIKNRSHTVPVTDAEIESAGTSFLDAIEKSLGLG